MIKIRRYVCDFLSGFIKGSNELNTKILHRKDFANLELAENLSPFASCLNVKIFYTPKAMSQKDFKFWEKVISKRS